MKRRNSSSAAPAVLALAGVLAAGCNPTFNWREVPLGDGLQALLPCKPDRAQRELDLGGQGVTLDMVGCATGGVTFAVARMEGGASLAEAQRRLDAWRRAARAPWRADGGVQEAPLAVPRAAAAPAAVELQATTPASAGGAPQPVRMRWFAQAEAGGRYVLYQATMLGTAADPQAAETFWEGLRLR